MLDLTLRDVTSIVGVIAFALLLMRLVADHDRLDMLGHLLAWALLSSVLIGAIEMQELQAKVGAENLPSEVSVKVILAHRIACIVIAVFWPKMLGRFLRYIPLRGRQAS